MTEHEQPPTGLPCGYHLSGFTVVDAIDAAARAMFALDQQLRLNSARTAWEHTHQILRDDWRRTARVAIDAARPGLLTEFLKDFILPSAQENQHRPEDCPCCRAAMSLSARVERGNGGA